MQLSEFFKSHPRVALAFSGGVDSAYLLYAAKACGAKVQPYFVKTAFQPQFELADAQRLCRALSIPLTILSADVLQYENITTNASDRCYHCKRVIFETLLKRAKEDGYDVMLDGTNTSDDAGDRPGMRALKELNVYSPLRICGLTKEKIRRLSREAGLFTHDKPAYACLATRIETGTKIEAEWLSRVERAEDALFQMGFTDFRVRVFHDAARLELPECQMARAIEERKAIHAALANDFSHVLIDLKGR